MKVTVSAIKADIGAIGGHTRPSDELLNSVKEFVKKNSKDLLIDLYIGYTGDDIHLIMSHTRGVEDEKIHKLAWDAFTTGTKIAKEQGLYGAGQDLLKDAFSGNVKGMGPGVAEIEMEEGQVKYLAYMPPTRQNQEHLTSHCGAPLWMLEVIQDC